MVIAYVTVCVEGGSVTLKEVLPEGETPGTEVVDFALRDNPFWPQGETHTGDTARSEWRGTLSAADFDADAKTASYHCDPGSGRSHQVGIELRSPRDGGVGYVESFTIVDHTGERSSLPLAVELCPYRQAWDPRCSYV